MAISNTQYSLQPQVGGASDPCFTVLVVDDSKMQRRLLHANLKKWGFEILEAENGAAALEICRHTNVDLVLSDWMMPHMNGLEFCKEFKALDRDGYGYFILLTSKSEKEAVAEGLDVGADDFLTKPVNAVELRARIQAGQRVLDMERQMVDKNRQVSDALHELEVIHSAIDRDLIEAQKLQQSLIPQRHRDKGQFQISLLLQSCDHVGGDLVGMFDISDHRMGVFSIDVSGHGVSSALLTARLAGMLGHDNPSQNVAFAPDANGGFRLHSPAALAALLNERMLSEMDTEHYFTMVFADIDVRTGSARVVQAGHPHPMVQRADGSIDFVGSGGPPIGLIAGVTYDQFDLQFDAGDRLLIYSDGVTECEGPTGNMFDDDGLVSFMRRRASCRGAELLDDLAWELADFSQGQSVDDVSAVSIECA